MADTLPNIELKSGDWIDLYAQSGIVVGTQITVKNIGTEVVWLVTKATIPTFSDGRDELAVGEQLENSYDDSGAWAFSANTDGLINIAKA